MVLYLSQDNQNDTIMKRFIAVFALSVAFVTLCLAGDRPVTFNQLPAAAQMFINTNFPADKLSYATVDDDLIRPEYNVLLVSGVRLEFANDGSMKKIEARKTGVPVELVPVQIRDYVKLHYPDATFVEYEIGRKTYEVQLSNRLDLKFNRYFALVEIDD